MRGHGEGRNGNGRGWEINQLYANETVLVAETRVHLQRIVGVFERVCGSLGLKINVGKSSVSG